MPATCDDCDMPLDELHDWKKHPGCPACNRPIFGDHDCAYCAMRAEVEGRAARDTGKVQPARTLTWEEDEDNGLEEVRLERLDGRLY